MPEKNEKINGVFLCNDPKQLQRVYEKGRMDKIRNAFDMEEAIITEKTVKLHAAACQKAEVIFSTWGMPALPEEAVQFFFPNLKAVFYAAGSVQGFARPFLNRDVRVFSAWQANAVPVAEYVFAQIVLAAKGCFHSVRKTSWTRPIAMHKAQAMPGNFETSIGLIGAGMIGGMVAEKLKTLQVGVYVFDPFLSQERAKELGVIQTDLTTLFERCDIISNHLANNEQTKGMLDKNCFDRMKKNAVFINTGRGAQVVEKDLVRAMRKKKGRLALLDVTCPEPPRLLSAMQFTGNILLTPHIAGSAGNEVWRMADYMLLAAAAFAKREHAPYEVTAKMLDTMA